MATPKPKPSDSGPRHIGFECRVCQTRMYAGRDEVGRRRKCPDCGAMTHVPSPEVAQPKPVPPALEGDQYELWDADASPTASELRAAQPPSIPIECSLCQTLYYASADEVGSKVACPDCGRRNVVPAAKAPPHAGRRRSASPSHEADYALDPAAVSSEPPPVGIAPRRPMLYEEEEAERERARAEAARRGQRYDARGRPILPRWPLASGVVPFLWSPGVPVCWLALSGTAVLALGIGAYGLSAIGAGAGRMSAGMNAIGGVCFAVVGCVLGMIWLAAVANIVVTIVTESSDGNERIFAWPNVNVVDWLPELVRTVVAGFASLFPGWLILQIFPLELPQQAAVMVGSVLITLPIVLLSQLDNDSVLGVLSGHVLASLVRCPLSWLMFWLEVAAIAAACGAAGYYGMRLGSWFVFVLVPLGVAAMLLTARLLGRLAWRIGEAMAVEE